MAMKRQGAGGWQNAGKSCNNRPQSSGKTLADTGLFYGNPPKFDLPHAHVTSELRRNTFKLEGSLHGLPFASEYLYATTKQLFLLL